MGKSYFMKSSIEYLPPEKQQEILLVIQIIKEVVKPEMIILFGSYARNSYVEHLYTTKDGARLEYISDYDFLVITKNSSEKFKTDGEVLPNNIP